MNQVLVTGAAGFIGSRFVSSLRERGAGEIISVDDPRHFSSRPEHGSIDFGRIVARDDLLAWLARERPPLTAIVHLGACTDTTATDEAYLYATNVLYSQRLWQYAALAAVPFVYASSAATYGDGGHGYDDDEQQIPQLRALNAYGRSKQLFDEWVLTEGTGGDAPPAWSGWKFFNVYGHGERHKGRMASVVLHAYDQLRSGGSIRLFRSHRSGIADGHQSRDFIDVRDVVEVLHFAATTPVARGIRNLGTGRARTFLDLARAVCSAEGVHESIEFVDTPVSLREQYQYFTEAQTSRLRATGYAVPFITLEDGANDYVARLRGDATQRQV